HELIFNYLNYSETNNIDEIFHYLLSIYNILKNNNQSRALQQINELYENLKIFDQKRLKNDIDIQLKEAKEIAHDVKVSITHNNNSKITQHYHNEAGILKLRIKELNNQIISLFILIVFIFLLKLIFRIDSFENIYTFITFLSIILTITGLITYLIKDYTQCKKLYDFYNIRHLELNALPEYMYELTPEQRKDLIIQLAPIYFIGVNDQKHQNTNNIDFSIIDQKLEEITKIVTKLQSLNK
ncbi:hypothetical protein, partial [Acinetobacter sp. MF4640]|uniref:hypothetical protein n=1 Tax=Acinetobacter sp. MF4640 TaxID=1960826 RepID=UPI0009CCAE9A